MDKKNIGALARFMGVPAHTIKYYEKIGLLSSDRDEHSNYRQYASQACTLLASCMKYRNMGFSLKEMDLMTKTADSSAHLELIGNRLSAVEEEIRRLTRLREVLAEYETRCRRAEERLGQWFIEPFDRVIYCRAQTDQLTFKNYMADEAVNMMDYSPQTTQIAILSRDYINGGAQDYSWGMALSFPKPQPEFENRPEFIRLAPGRAFTAWRRYTGHFLSNGEMAEDIRGLFHEYAPQFPSDVYALEAKIVHDGEGKDWNYFEIIVPLG